jgi:hypothetical protein
MIDISKHEFSTKSEQPIIVSPTPAVSANSLTVGFAFCPEHELLDPHSWDGWKIKQCPATNSVIAGLICNVVLRHPGISLVEIANYLPTFSRKKVKVILTALLRAGRIVRHADRSAYWVLDRQKARKL